MRAVIQRVDAAGVTVDGERVAGIGRGLLVLLGVAPDDGAKDISYMADKIAHLRIFDDPDGKLNLSVKDIGGSVLVVSQFTLYGDAANGRRPSFTKAAPAETAEALYDGLVAALTELGLPTSRGRFQAKMKVDLVNDGPVTLLVDSPKGGQSSKESEGAQDSGVAR